MRQVGVELIARISGYVDPLKNAIQAGLDRVYYRDRYDYRRALVGFERDLQQPALGGARHAGEVRHGPVLGPAVAEPHQFGGLASGRGDRAEARPGEQDVPEVVLAGDEHPGHPATPATRSASASVRASSVLERSLIRSAAWSTRSIRRCGGEELGHVHLPRPPPEGRSPARKRATPLVEEPVEEATAAQGRCP